MVIRIKGIKNGIMILLLWLILEKKVDALSTIAISNKRQHLPSSTRYNNIYKRDTLFVSSRQHQYSSTKLYSYNNLPGPRYDNLVGGLAQISLGASLCVLYSEWNIILTGCGPLDISDFTERFCYQIDILAAGVFLFVRIVSQGRCLTNLLKDDGEYMELEDFTLVQVTWAEWLAMASVVGALIALTVQYQTNVQMDGLSGIDIKLCRERIEFQKLYKN
mmetsp:Transcript_30470/g.34730  ORF Transcript_30470/g.34730 Transcript_30470/m.34730 type:complete len:219 (+) Transcript_30470:96-752(+)